MSQPFNYTGPPPPAGYGFQITTQGDQITGKNLICHRCGGLVVDESYFKDAHEQMHARQERLAESVAQLARDLKDLKERYLIEEEP